MTDAPVLIPCLKALREEFNRLAPNRDKASDGWIADSRHNETTSDHNPDDTPGLKTSGHDDDDDPEVHALDVDNDLRAPGISFDLCIKEIVDRHRRGLDDRLQYVIWNGRIASDSWGWTWRTYTGTSDPHTGHAHFSAKYGSRQESDTRPWGLLARFEGDDMDQDQFTNLLKGALSDGNVRRALADAVLDADDVPNLYGDKDINTTVQVRTALKAAVSADVRTTDMAKKLDALTAETPDTPPPPPATAAKTTAAKTTDKR